MDKTCDHVCECSSKSSSYAQSLNEMDFERGLWQAALDGNAVRVRNLLDKGRDADERDASGYTALHYASRSGDDKICRLLLDRGADVNAQTRSGKVTSLHRAAYCGHITVVKCLVKHGANPGLCDSDGQIPLHKAAEKAQEEVVKFLMSINPNLARVKDKNGRLPADFVPRHQPHILDLLSTKEQTQGLPQTRHSSVVVLTRCAANDGAVTLVNLSIPDMYSAKSKIDKFSKITKLRNKTAPQ